MFAVGNSGTGLDLFGSFLEPAAAFLASGLLFLDFFPAPIFLPFGASGSSVVPRFRGGNKSISATVERDSLEIHSSTIIEIDVYHNCIW